MTFTDALAGTEPDAIAPDGAGVFFLCQLESAGTALFRLDPGIITSAVRHPRVEEIWFVVSGRGRIWRRRDDRDEVLDLEPGRSLTLPRLTSFQFRCDGAEPLLVHGVTVPPWLGPDDAEAVEGPWAATGARS